MVMAYDSISTPNANYLGATKISYPAIIRIKPYKDNPECYMVFFNNMGVAFTF